MTNLEALKGLYEKLGGQAWTAQTISEGIAQVTEVAGGGGGAADLQIANISLTPGGNAYIDSTSGIDDRGVRDAIWSGKQIVIQMGTVFYPCYTTGKQDTIGGRAMLVALVQKDAEWAFVEMHYNEGAFYGTWRRIENNNGKFTLHITGTQGNYTLTETVAQVEEAYMAGKAFEVSVNGSFVLPASIGVSEYGEKIPYIPPVYWGENDAEQIFIFPNDGQYDVYSFAL